jgi:pyruvate carboxylase subunit B
MSIPYFVAMARRRLENMGVRLHRMKDMAGLLTPFTTMELVKALKSAVSMPDSSAQSCHIRTGQHGAHERGRSRRTDDRHRAYSVILRRRQPPDDRESGRSLCKEPNTTPASTSIKLQDIAGYFKRSAQEILAVRDERAASRYAHPHSQVPGGMISNLVNQLKEQGALDRMDEVLPEIPRVREDLGFPPLVTPTSQIVGTQAVLNVLTGGRYKSITNEVKRLSARPLRRSARPRQ